VRQRLAAVMLSWQHRMCSCCYTWMSCAVLCWHLHVTCRASEALNLSTSRILTRLSCNSSQAHQPEHPAAADGHLSTVDQVPTWSKYIPLSILTLFKCDDRGTRRLPAEEELSLQVFTGKRDGTLQRHYARARCSLHTCLSTVTCTKSK
jgi:hypothetical protein